MGCILSPTLSTLCNSICLSVSFSYSLPLSLRVSPLSEGGKGWVVWGQWTGGVGR